MRDSVKNFYLTFILTVILSCVLVFLSETVFQLEYGLALLIAILPIVIYGLIYFILYIVLLRRSKILLDSHEYDKVLSLSNQLPKWYYGGKNCSQFHLMAAIAHFLSNNDEKFLVESEQIVDLKWIAQKYYWRTIYFVIHDNETSAIEQFHLYINANSTSNKIRQTQELEILIKAAFSNSIDQEVVNDALMHFHSERIRKFLFDKKSIK